MIQTSAILAEAADLALTTSPIPTGVVMLTAMLVLVLFARHQIMIASSLACAPMAHAELLRLLPMAQLVIALCLVLARRDIAWLQAVSNATY